MTENDDTILTDPLFDDTICMNILDYLDGWSLKVSSEGIDGLVEMDEDVNAVANLQLECNKFITREEVERFYNHSLNEIKTYIYSDILPDDPRIMNSVYLWTAGRLWKKYNIRANDDLEDEANVRGYGDDLLINAKAGLKPFRFNKFIIW